MKQYSRRGVLKVIGLVGLTSVAGKLIPLPRANAAMIEPNAALLANFIQVSRQLTLHETLDNTVSEALCHALNLTQERFFEELTQLKTLLDANPDWLEQPVLRFPEAHVDAETLAKNILGGWYNGVVGKGYKAIYVTYINTLANKAVSDKLVPPSFSYGPCGSWAKQP
ncbi:sugar dehydrogenase complex small subunit [Rahnella selenatireducens]|uniref:sugar dehydrogenase complex small subunit n=1 Tax=Rahnella selenatireducens TaxID=3389797 RepID=UPI0039693CEF